MSKTVKENYQQIYSQIQQACENAGRSVKEINLVAVTKEVSVERTKEVVDAGIKCLGENRPEGLALKQSAIQGNVEWHFIGSLQSRKVKEVINHINVLHSLDRLSLAQEIEKRSSKVIRCFVQVNVSGEQSKHGLNMEEVLPFIEKLAVYSKIQIIGLMTMAPLTEEDEVIRNVFHQLKQLQQSIAQKKIPHAPCQELSMGMSGDFMIAIEEGATYIRIGTSLVGTGE